MCISQAVEPEPSSPRPEEAPLAFGREKPGVTDFYLPGRLCVLDRPCRWPWLMLQRWRVAAVPFVPDGIGSDRRVPSIVGRSLLCEIQ